MHAVGGQPVLGRLFTAEEDRKGGPVNKAMLGYGLWQRRYGGAPDALGKRIRLPMGEFEVVGVMPAGYGYPDRATLWLTMESWYALGLDRYREKQRDQRWCATVARLAPGVRPCTNSTTPCTTCRPRRPVGWWASVPCSC